MKYAKYVKKDQYIGIAVSWKQVRRYDSANFDQNTSVEA